MSPNWERSRRKSSLRLGNFCFEENDVQCQVFLWAMTNSQMTSPPDTAGEVPLRPHHNYTFDARMSVGSASSVRDPVENRAVFGMLERVWQ